MSGDDRDGESGLTDPTVTGGVVYVGSMFGKVYALDAVTGGLRWIYTTGTMADSGPAVVRGTVYVGSDDGKVFALNARS
jgi:outer membrane protein assembly factor BamB